LEWCLCAKNAQLTQCENEEGTFIPLSLVSHMNGSEISKKTRNGW
jgi:hypothetical protein